MCDKCNQEKCCCIALEPVCEKKVDPCSDSAPMGYSWGWLGSLIIWFVIFTVLFWLVYYSLKPSFVIQEGTSDVDTSKVLLAAVLSALIVVVLVWLIKIAVSSWH